MSWVCIGNSMPVRDGELKLDEEELGGGVWKVF